MAEPRVIEVSTPAGQLTALGWGASDAPIALCLHGFPDTAHGWRRLAPRLVAAGWQVVAPFLRGYAPSSIPADGSYHISALMDDALRVRDAAGGTDHDVVIGHDWGALVANGLVALPDSPFRRAVIMSVPPPPAFYPRAGKAGGLQVIRQIPVQLLLRSWYIGYFQLPLLPERSASWMVPLLWRRWSPGYDAAEDLRHVQAAIGTPQRWRAALGPYRATVRPTRPPARYAALNRHWQRRPQLPSLYLHGRDDGCVSPAFAAFVRPVLPAGSGVTVLDRAGHFLQHEQPDAVAELVLDFLAS